ncbi:hypothetical protein GCM10020008_00680 [Lentilactobacillus kefiri DSM 20587 = JCM 5818]
MNKKVMLEFVNILLKQDGNFSQILFKTYYTTISKFLGNYDKNQYKNILILTPSFIR